MNNSTIARFLLVAFVFFGCSKDNETVDTEYPEIDLTWSEAFPVQCSTIERGQTLVFRARFSDNAALGSFSLDIHHNFDHHTHSTEVNDCGLDPIKTPEDPLLYIKSFEIPGNPKAYDAEVEIEVPAEVDSGDYHFMIRVTDKEGWQTLKGLSIKIE